MYPNERIKYLTQLYTRELDLIMGETDQKEIKDSEFIEKLRILVGASTPDEMRKRFQELAGIKK